MNILHLEASTGWGGQEIRILREAVGMRNRGHSIFFAVSYGAELGKRAKERGFEVSYCSFQKKHWPVSFFTLLKRIKRWKIDLLNSHSSLDAWLGGLAARASRKPIIRTRHLSATIRKGFNSRVLYNYLADYVVTTCKKIVPTIVEQSQKAASLCESIPTGIVPEEITFDQKDSIKFREEMGFSNKDFVVGMVCFMRSWKGVDDFIEAAKITREIPHLKWVLIGGGHMQDYLHKIKEYQLDETLKCTGHLENPFAAINSIDLFTLLSTKNEGVSQASLQAAYLKKPLITTDVGGLAEVCIDGETGFIVPPNSPNEVVQKVLWLKDREDVRKRFGIQANRLVVNNFTFSHTLDRMEAVYHAVIPGKMKNG